MGLDHVYLELNPDELKTERVQAEQEGRDMSGLNAEFDALLAPEGFDAERAAKLLDTVQATPYRPDYPYVEPDDLEGIRAQRPAQPRLQPVDGATEMDRAYGAWLGRCAGCLLGKPVECWPRKHLQRYLEITKAGPHLTYYLTRSEEAIKELDLRYEKPMMPGLDRMPEDDDTNYTTIALVIMKEYGWGFTPADVANAWTGQMPARHTCTAERVAYRNFLNLIEPPKSASYRNMYREWIGAQIRADFWGYACPGDPEMAAELAWRDASISHVKNGIYGEMWAAATVAAGFVVDTPLEAIEAGLAQIPAKCRLTEGVRRVIGWREEGIDEWTAINRIHAEWDESKSHDWCHTISNAMIVTLALLWGEKDYGRTICLAVEAVFDTDCNGATAGSMLGALLGAKALPEKWIGPMNDVLETGVHGYTSVKIRQMAEETLAIRAARPK